MLVRWVQGTPPPPPFPRGRCSPRLRKVPLLISQVAQRQINCIYRGMRRIGHLVLITASLATAYAAVEQPGHDTHPYQKHWKQSTFGKVALSGVVVKAGIGQLRGHPRSYGGGMAGFGKRLGAGFTTHAVKTTVEHIIAATLHEDLHCHKSGKTGFRPRLWHALESTVITHSTRSGKAHPAVGRLSGHATAGIVSQVALHAGSGAITAGVGLAAEAGVNVAHEFWPRHNSQSR